MEQSTNQKSRINSPENGYKIPQNSSNFEDGMQLRIAMKKGSNALSICVP
jgi:hypothetical protein